MEASVRKQPSPLTPKGDQYYVISLKDINKLSDSDKNEENQST